MEIVEFLKARLADDGINPKMRTQRWLREVEAKRRIIEEHGDSLPRYAWVNGVMTEKPMCVRCSSWSYEGLDDENVEFPCPTLLAVASVYDYEKRTDGGLR